MMMKTANGLTVNQLATTAQAVFTGVLDQPRIQFPSEMWQEVAAKSIGILGGHGEDDSPVEFDAVFLAEQLHAVTTRWQNQQEEFEKLDGKEQIAWEAVARTMAELMQMTPDEFGRGGQKIVEVASHWASRQSRVPQEV